MKTVYNAYRVLAFVVGVLATILWIGVVLRYQLLTQNFDVTHLGRQIVSVDGLIHGNVYIVYLIVTFILSAKARWSLPFTGVALAAGLLPLLVFWVERQVSNRMREEHPELFAPRPTQSSTG